MRKLPVSPFHHICKISDVPVESSETYKVQEEHIRLYHELCARVEAAFFEV